MTRKPFPSRVRWLMVWKHRWLILDLINQLAHGGETQTKKIGRFLGARDSWSEKLHAASRECIGVDRGT